MKMLWDGDEDNMKFIYVIAMYDSSSTAQPNTDWANKMQDMMTSLNFGEVKNTAQSNGHSSSSSSSNNNDDNKDDDNKDDDNSSNDDKPDDNNTSTNNDNKNDNEQQEEKVIMTEEETKEYWKGIKDWDENTIKWGVVDVSSDKDGDFDQLWSELIEPFHTGPQDR